MSELNRREFVRTSAGAAAGITAVGALALGPSEAGARATAAHPVVAYVRDPRSGEIAVMSGNREVIVRDRKLAALIARAAG